MGDYNLCEWTALGSGLFHQSGNALSDGNHCDSDRCDAAERSASQHLPVYDHGNRRKHDPLCSSHVDRKRRKYSRFFSQCSFVVRDVIAGTDGDLLSEYRFNRWL
jgi:hypothetical protein